MTLHPLHPVDKTIKESCFTVFGFFFLLGVTAGLLVFDDFFDLLVDIFGESLIESQTRNIFFTQTT